MGSLRSAPTRATRSPGPSSRPCTRSPHPAPEAHSLMIRITPGVHRLLDLVTIVGFGVAPSLLGLSGAAAILSYTLAAVHLLLTLLTHFPGDGKGPVPFPLHGAVEGVVGVALAVLPFVAGWTGTPRIFVVGAGIVIIAVRLLS